MVNSYRKAIDKKNERLLTNEDWTLCLGAGICTGILPNWFELTKRLINRTFDFNWDSNEFNKRFNIVGFGLDAWIQACWNNLKKDMPEHEFNSILREELYKDLFDQADKHKIKESLVKLLDYPRSIKKQEGIKLYKFFLNDFKDVSLIQIVKFLSEDKVNLPTSIITFNIDNLLYSLLWLFNINKSYEQTGKFESPKEPFKKINQPYEKWADKIPIFHLHGILSPNTTTDSMSSENIIFLESAYSKVAGNMFTWAQSTYLYTSLNTRMLNIGLSMADPNIRRWLSWTSENINAAITTRTGRRATTLRHIWIQQIPNDDLQLKDFFEISLQHLSVKVIWLDSWEQLHSGMMNLLKK